jgi:Leucine-rich repeat (LRR) protein
MAKSKGLIEAEKRIAAYDGESNRLNLTDLRLKTDELETLIENLPRLTNLQLLDLRDNQITVIPDSLSRLTNLQMLDLDNNQITHIPDMPVPPHQPAFA